jgi:hypothetical protein
VRRLAPSRKVKKLDRRERREDDDDRDSDMQFDPGLIRAGGTSHGMPDREAG